MLIPIPIFIPLFPYVDIQYREINLFKDKTMYEKHTFGNDGIYHNDLLTLINKNKTYLLDNNVPLNKIRFVFQPTFNYDVDKDIINPKFDVLFPINGNNGLFCKDKPEITINKPKNLITIAVDSYRFDDNYKFIKDCLKSTKRGIVIYISDYPNNEFCVDDDVIRMSIIDMEINNHKTIE